MPPEDALASSFRDPAGFVFRRDGVLYRGIRAPGRPHYEALMSSGLYEELAGAETVVVAAGKVRSPGMRRQDLLDENASLIADLAPRVAALCPQATVLVATEPVDAATMLFHRLSG
ncbi:MAG: hypothetical protein HGA94_03890, partial [Candidatus Aminicenantes bacterium]|nr:hypothetical protein [Candidatus Aminicenantes bacterium]